MSEGVVAVLVERNSPLFTPSRKATHSRQVNDSTEPSGSWEFRTRTASSMTATSTQLPWPPDAVLLCQVMSDCSESVIRPPPRGRWTLPRIRARCRPSRLVVCSTAVCDASTALMVDTSVPEIRTGHARPTPLPPPWISPRASVIRCESIRPPPVCGCERRSALAVSAGKPRISAYKRQATPCSLFSRAGDSPESLGRRGMSRLSPRLTG